MNLENLKTLIKCYEDNLEVIYGSKHDELFKWRAVQHFKNVWYAPENEGLSFALYANQGTVLCLGPDCREISII